jgi:hypothetical protein
MTRAVCSAPPLCQEGPAFQADDEGSIPFTRSNDFWHLERGCSAVAGDHRCPTAPGFNVGRWAVCPGGPAGGIAISRHAHPTFVAGDAEQLQFNLGQFTILGVAIVVTLRELAIWLAN